MSELRQIPIYRAFSRPNTILGCEREPLLMTGLVAATLIFVAATLPTLIIGLILWFICYGLLRKMAKADPQMSKLYIKHIRYQRYYPAHSTPFADSTIHKRER